MLRPEAFDAREPDSNQDRQHAYTGLCPLRQKVVVCLIESSFVTERRRITDPHVQNHPIETIRCYPQRHPRFDTPPHPRASQARGSITNQGDDVAWMRTHALRNGMSLLPRYESAIAPISRNVHEAPITEPTHLPPPGYQSYPSWCTTPRYGLRFFDAL